MISGDEGTRAGDNIETERLIRELYVQQYGFLVNLICRVVASRSLAEDIVQDTFYEALCSADMLRNHPKPVGWLVDVAKNKVKNYRRRAQNRTTVELSECEEFLPCLEERYNAAELHLLLESSLSGEERRLFYDFYVRGFGQADMAAAENTTESAIKNRLYRIRQKLRRAMKEPPG